MFMLLIFATGHWYRLCVWSYDLTAG